MLLYNSENFLLHESISLVLTVLVLHLLWTHDTASRSHHALHIPRVHHLAGPTLRLSADVPTKSGKFGGQTVQGCVAC